MKIKRYMAASMRAALAQVRTEQGPDALILPSRRVEEGIEVIAAVDYDEALFADATLKRAPVAPPEAAAPEVAATRSLLPKPEPKEAPLRAQSTKGSAPLKAPMGLEWVKLSDAETPAYPPPARVRAPAAAPTRMPPQAPD